LTKCFEQRLVRFLVSGAANTLLTYAVYIVLLQFLPYAAAYTISYIVGIAINYAFNVFWVFEVKPKMRSAAAWPVIFLMQYLVGISLLALLVNVLRVDAWLAPLAVLVVTVPISYLLSRLILTGGR
jgi:putative flippase GtrA